MKYLKGMRRDWFKKISREKTQKVRKIKIFLFNTIQLFNTTQYVANKTES